MRVLIPTPLRSYTGKQSEVEANGPTLAELLVDLDRRYPGIRFRMIDITPSPITRGRRLQPA